MNIPYNQAFLEEGGLAPSASASTLNSFKGRIIVVVGNRANYPAKVNLRAQSRDFKLIVENNRAISTVLCYCAWWSVVILSRSTQAFSKKNELHLRRESVPQCWDI